MKYFKAFIDGNRKICEYIVSIVISALMLLVTFPIMPIIVYFTKHTTAITIWFVFIILTFLIAIPLGTTSALMIKAKKMRKNELCRAREKLTEEFQSFKYRANGVNDLERNIIHRIPIKFEAKINKKSIITIKAIAPDGGVVHTEETIDYAWFNQNFYPSYHKF